MCVTQALLAGLLLTLADDLGGDARSAGLPIPGLVALLGLAVGGAWVWWLAGGSGWLLAAVDLAVALLTGALWLLSLLDTGAPRIDPLVGLIALSCAIYGIVAGVFLPGPRRGHWKGGASQPRRGLPTTRTTPARFSPPVQKVVDERLASVSLSRVSLSALRIPSMRLPSRPAKTTDEEPEEIDGALTAAPSIGSTAGAASAAPKVTATTDAEADGDAASTTEPEADGTDVPTLIHRILTGDEPLSVSAMRLSGIPAATDDLAVEDDDETLPFPTVGPGHGDGQPTPRLFEDATGEGDAEGHDDDETAIGDAPRA